MARLLGGNVPPLNLRALQPQWNSDDRSLRYGFEVEDADVSIGENVEVELYFADNRLFGDDERLGEKFASQGIPEIMGNQVWYSFPIENIPLNLPTENEQIYADRILTVVDPNNLVRESNENDNERGIDYFFVRKIPQIMRNIGDEWEVPARFQERWLNGDRKVLSTDINEVFEAQPDTQVLILDWILRDDVDTNNRAQEAFNKLTDEEAFRNPDGSFNNEPGRLFNDVARQELVNNLALRLRGEPLGTITSFGIEGRSAEALSRQSTQLSSVETNLTIDPLSGALGNFSFYAIPLGAARKEANDQINVTNDQVSVTVTGVAIYARDVFEFNGSQFLGFWNEPDQVSILPFSGDGGPLNINVTDATPITNGSYNEYREQTGLGRDFLVLSNVRTIEFESPIQFTDILPVFI